MKPELALRLMTLSDLPFAHSLSALAGWNQTIDDWKRCLAHSSEGCFLAEWYGAPAGTVTTICYGAELGWIGMLLVHPDFRGRGIGRALLARAVDHLRSRSISCIKLDATPQGQPLYSRLGFCEEWPLTRWENGKPNASASTSATDVRLCQENDFPAIESLDRKAFGARRRPILRSLLRENRVALVHVSYGLIAGYGVLRDGARAVYLGPLVAASPQSATELAAALLAAAAPHPVYWDIPDLNAEAAALAKRFGLTPQRHLMRMFLGANQQPGSARLYFAIADPALG